VNALNQRTSAPRWRLQFLSAFVIIALVVFASNAVPPSAARGADLAEVKNTEQRVSENYSQLPLSFERNIGQLDAQAKYVVRGNGVTTYLTDGGAVFTMPLPDNTQNRASAAVTRNRGGRARLGADVAQVNPAAKAAAVAMFLVNAKAAPSIIAEGLQAVTSNYFRGADPSQWRTGVPHFAQVRYVAVYPGVDMLFFNDRGRLRYDFVVQPGSDPSAIALRFEGMRELTLSENGDLLIHVGEVESPAVLRMHKPYTYQEVMGKRVEVSSRFVVRGETVAFDLGVYDPALPLVIDPTLVYSTFLGSTEEDLGLGIFVDADGAAYVTGNTFASDFPTTLGVYDITVNGAQDAFVAKLNAAGSALVFASFLGGSAFDSGTGVTADASGVYVTGQTQSTNFPTSLGAFDTTHNGPTPTNAFNGYDAFLVKLNAAGSALTYGTFLGGTSEDFSVGLAVDGSQQVTVAGTTASANFPTTGGAFDTTANGNYDIYVTEFNNAGTALASSTFVGGSQDEIADGIVLSGNTVYVTGDTASANFPVTGGAFDTVANGANDVVAFRLNTTTNSLSFATYLGGAGVDVGFDIALDTAGNVYLTGTTDSANFPTTAQAADTTANGAADSFVAKLNPTGSTLTYSTYLGGSGDDAAYGVAVDAGGNAYVLGETLSANFPVTANASQAIHNDVTFFDATLTKLNASGGVIAYSSFLGGDDDDTGYAIDLRGNANSADVFLTGWTRSSDFPTTPGAFDTTYNDTGFNNDAFVARVTLVGVRPDTIGVRRPSNGLYFLRNSNTAGAADFTLLYGFPTDTGLAGDWNGDGIDTIGYYRPSTGQFVLSDTPSALVLGIPSTTYFFTFGSLGDKPVAGDWDGDGKDTVGVYRASDRTFYLRGTLAGGLGVGVVPTVTHTLPFAEANDVPLAGDWDCDGRATVGLYRPSNSVFFLTNETVSVPITYTVLNFGVPNDIPFTGDFDADGCTEIGIYRNSMVQMKFALTNTPSNLSFVFGAAGDRPLAGVWADPLAPLTSAPAFEVAPAFEPTK
jgi:hypothetical protein